MTTEKDDVGYIDPEPYADGKGGMMMFKVGKALEENSAHAYVLCGQNKECACMTWMSWLVGKSALAEHSNDHEAQEACCSHRLIWSIQSAGSFGSLKMKVAAQLGPSYWVAYLWSLMGTERALSTEVHLKTEHNPSFKSALTLLDSLSNEDFNNFMNVQRCCANRYRMFKVPRGDVPRGVHQGIFKCHGTSKFSQIDTGCSSETAGACWKRSTDVLTTHAHTVACRPDDASLAVVKAVLAAAGEVCSMSA
eukprot:1160905-Pelagomonas_calceolata.AAC.3